MMLNIYSEYTNPEGFIKIDDLITLALKSSVDCLGITDHGNLAGILDFQQKALAMGIKPIRGLDVFYKISEDTFLRAIFYIKSEAGYREILALLPKIKLSSKGYNYFKITDLLSLEYLFMVVDFYDIDALSHNLKQEIDFKIIYAFLKQFDIQKNIFLRIMKSETVLDDEVKSFIVDFKQLSNYEFIYLQPVYYLKASHYRVKTIQRLLYDCEGIELKNQYFKANYELENILENNIFEQAMVNSEFLKKNCNLLLEREPIRYQGFLEESYGLNHNDLAENYNFDYDFQAQESYKKLSELVFSCLKDIDSKKEYGINLKSLTKRIKIELEFCKERRLSEIILSMKSLRDNFLEEYSNGMIFFGGIWQYFYMTHFLNLTIFSVDFIGLGLFETVLKSRKFSAEVEVYLSSNCRENFLEFIHKRIGYDKICFLSEHQRWNIISLIAILGKKLNFSKEKIKLFTTSIPLRYKHSSLQQILKIKSLATYLNAENLGREFILYASLLDNTFRFFNTNPHSIIVGNDNLSQKIPIFILKKEDYPIRKTFFNRKSASFFGSWTIKIVSNSSLNLLNNEKINKDFSFYNEEAKYLVKNLIKKVDDFIPYFKLNENTHFLEVKNKLLALSLYNATSVHKLREKVSDYQKEERFYGQINLDKKLQNLHGRIIFREQFYDILQKLFPEKKYGKYYSLIFNSYNIKQLKENLNFFNKESDDEFKIQWLKEKLTTILFYSFLTDSSVKLGIALNIAAYKRVNRGEFFLNNIKDILQKRYLTEKEELIYNQFFLLNYPKILFNKPKLNNVYHNIITNSNDISFFTLPLESIKKISSNDLQIIYSAIQAITENGYAKADILIKIFSEKVIGRKSLQVLLQLDFFSILPNKILQELKKYAFANQDTNLLQPSLFTPNELGDGLKDFTKELSISFDAEKKLTGFAYSLFEMKYILNTIKKFLFLDEQSFVVVPIEIINNQVYILDLFTNQIFIVNIKELMLKGSDDSYIFSPFISLLYLKGTKGDFLKNKNYFNKDYKLFDLNIYNIKIIRKRNNFLKFNLYLYCNDMLSDIQFLEQMSNLIITAGQFNETDIISLNIIFVDCENNFEVESKLLSFSYFNRKVFYSLLTYIEISYDYLLEFKE